MTTTPAERPAMDVLTTPLPIYLPTRHAKGVRLRPASEADIDALTPIYFASYPEGVAADSPDDACQELRETFDGKFGALIPEASRVAYTPDGIVGAIFVVERSPWDDDLPGPFIVDLFVAPEYRGQQIGKDLLQAATAAVILRGDTRLSLRAGEGTSEAARSLYNKLGFRPWMPGISPISIHPHRR